MNDIKKRQISSPVKNTISDLSFLTEDSVDAQHINKPKKFFAKVADFIKSPLMSHGLVGVFLFGLGFFTASFVLQADVSNTENTPQKTNLVAGVSDRAFDPTVYYKIELINGDIYYALITGSNFSNYTIERVFYTVEQTKTESGQEKITLAQYAPANESQPLFIPREQVKLVTTLSQDSSIAQAINTFE